MSVTRVGYPRRAVPIEEHDLVRADLAAALSRLDEIVAREAALREALRGLIAIITRAGGYMSPEDQQTLRDARAVIA